MSLINDALKRASQAQKQQPPPPASETLTPAASPAPAPSSQWLILLLLVALVAMGGFLIWQSQRDPARHSQAQPAPIPAAAVSHPTSSPATTAPAVIPPAAPAHTPAPTPVAAPVAVTPPPVVPAAATPQPATPVTTAPATASLPVAAAPIVVEKKPDPSPAKPAFPTLKLQAIVASRTNPTALINGKTLAVGEDIEGAVVKAIDARKVTLEFEGESRTLNLR